MSENNDREWRLHLFSELKEIKEDVKDVQKEMSTLKIKVAGISAIISAVLTYVFKGN